MTIWSIHVAVSYITGRWHTALLGSDDDGGRFKSAAEVGKEVRRSKKTGTRQYMISHSYEIEIAYRTRTPEELRGRRDEVRARGLRTFVGRATWQKQVSAAVWRTLQ